MKNGQYILVIAPEEFPGLKYRGRYCYEHILVWWKNHNEVPNKEEVIHHINGDKTDNRIENLEKFNYKKHSIFHHPKTKEFVSVKCNCCKKNFKLEKRIFTYRTKNKQSIFYCDRICMGSVQGRVNNFGRNK